MADSHSSEPSTSSVQSDTRQKQVVSLLDRLKQPDSSDLSRKRKITANKGGQGGNRRTVRPKNEKTNYEPQVSAKKRLEEFKNESFKVMSDTILFCQSCKEEISVKKSIIKGHISSKKRTINKDKLSKTSKRDIDIAEALGKFDKEHHPKGETLLTATRVYRVKVVQAFLKSGTPLNRLDYFRDIFQEASVTLTTQSNMRQLIPFILEEEQKSIAKELFGKDVSIVFDGTTRWGSSSCIGPLCPRLGSQDAPCALPAGQELS